MNYNYKQNDSKYVVGTYGRYDFCPSSGKGATLKTDDGREFIDFTSGIGVNSLGYGDKDWIDAVSKQAADFQHISNLFYSEVSTKLAERLCGITSYSKLVYANSGAEANECAIKIARKYSYDKYGSGRSAIVTLKNSFHGRTITTLSATGQDAMHQFFDPFTEGFRYAPANDFTQTEKLLASDVCAVMLEFIQGEGGVLPLDKEFVKKLYDFCLEHDILFIADEVQTGVGRTGKFLASEHYSVFPDMTTLAKGLGNGLPIGAVLTNSKTCGVLQKGQHGTTFGGNPVACAGANIVLDKVANPEFLESVHEKGLYIKKRLSEYSKILKVDGEGLMFGIELDSLSSADAAAQCVENGLLVLTAKEKLRLLPPLVITYDEIDKGLDILKKILD